MHRTPMYGDTLRAMAKDSTLGRPGDPYADVAPVYLFFASDDSQFVTGQTLNADGGYVIVP